MNPLFDRLAKHIRDQAKVKEMTAWSEMVSDGVYVWQIWTLPDGRKEHAPLPFSLTRKELERRISAGETESMEEFDERMKRAYGDC